jgi:hypothetical protein
MRRLSSGLAGGFTAAMLARKKAAKKPANTMLGNIRITQLDEIRVDCGELIFPGTTSLRCADERYWR